MVSIFRVMEGEWFPVRKSSQDTLEHHFLCLCGINDHLPFPEKRTSTV